MKAKDKEWSIELEIIRQKIVVRLDYWREMKNEIENCFNINQQIFNIKFIMQCTLNVKMSSKVDLDVHQVLHPMKTKPHSQWAFLKYIY